MSFADQFLATLNYDKSRLNAQKLSSDLWAQPQKQGSLLKKGHVRKNWKQRWFRLQDRNLFYFRTPEEMKPLGVLDLTAYTVGSVDIRDRPHGILLKSDDARSPKDYLVSAPSDVERQDWMSAFIKGGAHKAAGPLYSVLLEDSEPAPSSSSTSSTAATSSPLTIPTATPVPIPAVSALQNSGNSSNAFSAPSPVAPVHLIAPARKSTSLRRESIIFKGPSSAPTTSFVPPTASSPAAEAPRASMMEAAMEKLSQDVLGVLYNEVDWTKSYTGSSGRPTSQRIGSPVTPSSGSSTPSPPPMAAESTQAANRSVSPTPRRTVINMAGPQSTFAPPDGSVSSARFSAATRARQSLADELLRNLDDEEFQRQYEEEATTETKAPSPSQPTSGWSAPVRPNVDNIPASLLGGDGFRREAPQAQKDLPVDPRERDRIETRERLLAMKDHLVKKTDPLKVYDCAPKAIGKGGVGEVFLGTKRETGEKVAIKKLQTFFKGKDRLPMILNEIAVMANSAHGNIVSYMDSYAVGSELWVMMEFMDKGSLYDIVKMCINLEEKAIAYIVREILQALAFIHERKRIHRDIKVDNVLISSRGHVKLADFGAAVQLTFQRMKRQTMTGTPYYMSPEVIAGKPYDELVDIWSTGILCIELAELAPPYYDLSPEQALDKIVKEGVKGLGTANKKFSHEFVDFVNNRCLQYDPAKRSTATTLLQHPFLKKACTRQEFATLMASWTDFEVDSGGGCTIL